MDIAPGFSAFAADYEAGKPQALYVRLIADLEIDTLALMHGPAYKGDCNKALLELADGYAHLLATAAGAQ